MPSFLGCRGAERRSVYLFLHSTYVWSPSIRSDDKILFLFRTRVRRRNVQLQHWLHCRAAKSFVWCLILSHPSRWVCRMPGYRLATKTTTKVLGTSLPNWREKNQQKHEKFICFVRFWWCAICIVHETSFSSVTLVVVYVQTEFDDTIARWASEWQQICSKVWC